jgi:hypothetical protein
MNNNNNILPLEDVDDDDLRFLVEEHCGKIQIKAGKNQLEPFGVFLLIKR